MLVVGDVHFFIFGLEDGHQGGELFFGSTREAPVNEWIVGVLLEHIPGDQAAGVDKVGFEVRVLGDLFVIEGWRREDVEVFQAAALQQFGDGSLQRHTKVGWAPKEAKQVPLAGLNSTTQITGYLPPSEPS